MRCTACTIGTSCCGAGSAVAKLGGYDEVTIFIGRLFDEGTIARVALALERRLGVASETPQGF